MGLSLGIEPIDLVATSQLIQILSLAEAEHGYASLPPTFELDSPAVVSLVNGTKVRYSGLLITIYSIGIIFFIILANINVPFPRSNSRRRRRSRLV